MMSQLPSAYPRHLGQISTLVGSIIQPKPPAVRPLQIAPDGFALVLDGEQIFHAVIPDALVSFDDVFAW